MPQKCFLSPWAPGHWCLDTAVKLEEHYLPTARRGVYICFTTIPTAQAMCLYDFIVQGTLPCCAQILVYLCLLLHRPMSLMVQTKKIFFFLSCFFHFCQSSAVFIPKKQTPLYIAVLVQDALPLLLQCLDNQFTLTWPGWMEAVETAE